MVALRKKISDVGRCQGASYDNTHCRNRSVCAAVTVTMTIGRRESHGSATVVSAIRWTARIWNDRLLAAVWAERVRLLGVELGSGARVLGSPIIERTAGSRIVVGPRSMLVSRSEATALGVSRPVILRTIR